MFLMFYGPTGLMEVTRNGVPVVVAPQTEAGWVGYGLNEQISSGESVDFRLEFLSMPVTPGTYTGSAAGAITGFTTTFVVTVLAVAPPPGGLPSTGSGGFDTTTGIAAGLVAVGLGLFGVTRLRRRHAVA